MGTEVIYAASSVSLAVLEILVNYSVVPVNYSLTSIDIAEEVAIESIPHQDLPPHWDSTAPGLETQRFGDQWVEEERSAVLSVPSSVIPSERNFVINPSHPDFPRIQFSNPHTFVFDPRLRPV